ncbi:MAG: hypothetical protein A6F70_08940 [Cycloclasticus sp. symbiont of Bathymodiolus heckerae]|nr:MAG: hypothetical protein A6F70_08940 [Cycloclasticus sp. symbiont of Bathymodiolus heckerae]
MRTFNKKPLALGVAAGMAMLVASTGAMAISAGTDLNLSGKARAGGMAGAAYTMPQEASAAVFGNPATLSQFKGINMNFGASWLSLSGVENVQTDSLGGSNTSTSDADNYIIPDFGLTIQVSPNLVIGTGLEVDAGLGADYRDDPINLLPGAGDFTLPLLVEVISFNANLAAAYQATDQLSLGASVTVGFGLAQLGTAGATQGLTALNGLVNTGGNGAGAGIAVGPDILADFGGTTSSVHDIGFGASLGAVYEVQEGVLVSATVKSPVEYNFKNIIHADPTAIAAAGGSIAADGYQDLTLQQPAEVILGIALNDVIMPGLLIEADAIWKNWSDAHAYEDAYEDQWLLAIGAQYEAGDFTYRVGYSYAEDILSDAPNGTLSGLDGLGSVPLYDDPGANGALGALSVDVITIVQNSLLPVIWNHTITAGIGYKITDAVSVDAYAAYAFGENEKDTLSTLSTVADTALGGSGLGGTLIENEAKIDYELMIGAGINIALP